MSRELARFDGISCALRGIVFVRLLESTKHQKGEVMPKIASWMPRTLAASLAVLSVLAVSASAQQPPTVRIRGTIESIDGKTLSIKTREGTDVKVKMTDDIGVIGIAKTSLSEIKPGSYIGVSAIPQS